MRTRTRLADAAIAPGLRVATTLGVGLCDGCKRQAANRTAVELGAAVSVLVLCASCAASLRDQLPLVDLSTIAAVARLHLRSAIEHLRAAADRNGAVDVVGWCTLALAARDTGYEEALRHTAAVDGRWKISPTARKTPGKHPWANPRFRVGGVFDTRLEAERVAGALNAIEAEVPR